MNERTLFESLEDRILCSATLETDLFDLDIAAGKLLASTLAAVNDSAPQVGAIPGGIDLLNAAAYPALAAETFL